MISKFASFQCFIPDENTRSKFLFYGGPDCVNISDGLEYYIDSGIIPDFLGGPCPVSVCFLVSICFYSCHFSICFFFLFH